MCNCKNYLNYPNLFFIVKRSRNIDDIEIRKPNIIIGFDRSLTCLKGPLIDEEVFLSLSLLMRLKKGLLTLKIRLIDL